MRLGRRRRGARFRDRHDAGRQLAPLVAARLDELAHGAARPVCLGLPRGGVPVAAEVAAALGCPLDVLVVRKLGVPGHRELAMGAIGEGEVEVTNDDIVRRLRISADAIAAVRRRELAELTDRVRRYRGDHPAVDVADRDAVVVDDGLATGASARAALTVLRHRDPRSVTLAVPVAPGDAEGIVGDLVDALVAVYRPTHLGAVGSAYEDFTPTSDTEVVELLAAAH